MKLRTKIQLSISVTMILLLLTIGYAANITNSSASSLIVNNSMSTSATLASDFISKQLENYLNTVTLVGHSEKLARSNETASSISTYLSQYVETYNFTSANLLNVQGESISDPNDENNYSDRDYFTKALAGIPNISEVNLSKKTGTYGVSVAAPVYDEKNEIKGVVYFRLDTTFMQEIIKNIEISQNSYAYLIDSAGNVIVHPDESLILNYNLLEQDGTLKEVATSACAGENGNKSYLFQEREISCGYSPIENDNGWSIIIASPQSDYDKLTAKTQRTMIALDIVGVIIAILISGVISGSISKPIKNVKDALVHVSDGDFSVELPPRKGQDEIAVLQNTTTSLLKTLSNIIGNVNVILDNISRHDLTTQDMPSYPGEFDRLSRSVNSIKEILNHLILEVQNSVYNVENGSHELAQATASMSQGAVAQANSIQTLADDLTDVVSKISNNSEQEEVVNAKLSNLNEQIQLANEQMQNLMSAVESVETMSVDIQKIVGTIDSIAFQTNILSLNASVEAARAGEMGKGFAVVAEEVRSLAVKSGDASRKTSDLINACVASISNAKTCADATFESLSGIVTDSSEIASAFQNITEATVEQATKANRIQTEVDNISDVIQTNTATSEETAASTAVLSEQAENLKELIKDFRIKNY